MIVIVCVCADLCLSLYSVRIQSILIEQLLVVLQVTPKVHCILPQLKQKQNLGNYPHRLSHIQLEEVYAPHNDYI